MDNAASNIINFAIMVLPFRLNDEFEVGIGCPTLHLRCGQDASTTAAL